MHFKCFVPPPPAAGKTLEIDCEALRNWKRVLARPDRIIVFFVCLCAGTAAGKINQKLNWCSDGKRSGDYFSGLGFAR
jgi:hypothetical protein